MTYLAFVLAVLFAWDPAVAGDDHDRARGALEEGRIRPFKEILAEAESAFPGQLIEAELEDEDGALVYEIKLLTRDGRVLKLLYDARTGALLKSKGRDGRR